jgi:hypothetical protein
MANFPGGQGVLPGVFTNVQTQSNAAAVPGGQLIAAIIGEGSRTETIIAQAVGGGQDGLNPTYTSTTGSDGRHFQLNFSPIISNRTTLYLNGIPLNGIEGVITPTSTFPDTYDYMVDITNGEIELQTAYIVYQGGSQYLTGINNVGIGTLQNLQLVDENDPPETWTIKCVSVMRNSSNQPIAGTATFVAYGSVSGNVLDAYGNTVTWVADGYVVSNGILSFSISETGYPSATLSPFVPGDSFTVVVNSGVLVANDSLTATYIAVADINNPTFLTSLGDVITAHGSVSLSNPLSLGCQLAFANDTPGIMCVQAAPGIPRRTSFDMVESFNATSTNVDDFVIPFPPGITPDVNSAIHIFVTNPTTEVETQLLPNMFPFYTLNGTFDGDDLDGAAGAPTLNEFVFSNANPPGGNSFSYSVIQAYEDINYAVDGYINAGFPNLNSVVTSAGSPQYALFSSATIGEFNNPNTYVGNYITIYDATNLADNGTFYISAIQDGQLVIETSTGISIPGTFFSAFIGDTSVHYQLWNPATNSAVPSSAFTDGTLVATTTPEGTFTSASGSSTSLWEGLTSAGLVGVLQLQITSSADASNVGLFNITAYGGTNQITISKCFVSEANLEFEIINPLLTSQYLVLNKNIVPNGNALRVTIVEEQDASFFDAGWINALASLETQEISILVCLPLSTISAIFENAENHCLTMSNIRNRKERVLFLGAINGLTPANLTGQTLAAVESLGVLEGIQGNTVAEILAGDTEDLANYSVPNAYGDTFRAVYFYPDQIVVQVGSQNQIIDGFYIAAAAAGYQSSLTNVSVPLTNKIMSGFTILSNRTFNELTLESLAAAGVCTLAPVAGGGLVLWGLTTTQSGFPEEQEISIVFIRDTIAKALRSGFAAFIGVPQTNDTLAMLNGRAVSLLNGFITQQLITAYTGLTVVQDSVEPRQVDVSVVVSPTYPLNWIYINVGVGLI